MSKKEPKPKGQHGGKRAGAGAKTPRKPYKDAAQRTTAISITVPQGLLASIDTLAAGQSDPSRSAYIVNILRIHLEQSIFTLIDEVKNQLDAHAAAEYAFGFEAELSFRAELQKQFENLEKLKELLRWMKVRE
jgi:hypothetical protein